MAQSTVAELALAVEMSQFRSLVAPPSQLLLEAVWGDVVAETLASVCHRVVIES
jgi:hypothetical protein